MLESSYVVEVTVVDEDTLVVGYGDNSAAVVDNLSSVVGRLLSNRVGKTTATHFASDMEWTDLQIRFTSGCTRHRGRRLRRYLPPVQASRSRPVPSLGFIRV